MIAGQERSKYLQNVRMTRMTVCNGSEGAEITTCAKSVALFFTRLRLNISTQKYLGNIDWRRLHKFSPLTIHSFSRSNQVVRSVRFDDAPLGYENIHILRISIHLFIPHTISVPIDQIFSDTVLILLVGSLFSMEALLVDSGAFPFF